MSKVVSVAAILGFTLIILGAVAAAVYLTLHGHPWMAFLVLLICGSVSFKTGKAAEGDE